MHTLEQLEASHNLAVRELSCAATRAEEIAAELKIADIESRMSALTGKPVFSAVLDEGFPQ